MNKIKLLRIVFILLFIIILASSNLCVNAQEAIVFDEKANIKDDTVIYTVDITKNSNVCGLSLEVLYDEKQIKLESSAIGDIINNGMAKSNTKIDGKVILTYISTESLKSKGTILELKFSIISSNTAKLNITSIISECINKNCDDLSFSIRRSDIINPNYKDDNTSSDSNPNKNNPASSTNSNISSNDNSSSSSNNQSSNHSKEDTTSSNQTTSNDSKGNLSTDKIQKTPNSNTTNSSNTQSNINSIQVINKAPKNDSLEPDNAKAKYKTIYVIIFFAFICAIISALILYRKYYRRNKK